MTAETSSSPAVRRLRPDGYALLELLVAVLILSCFSSLFLQAATFSSRSFYIFPFQYTRLKSEALLKGERIDYEDDTDMDYPAICFNENGTVNQARTLSFPRGSHTSEIVIELGPGALVFR